MTVSLPESSAPNRKDHSGGQKALLQLLFRRALGIMNLSSDGQQWRLEEERPCGHLRSERDREHHAG